MAIRDVRSWATVVVLLLLSAWPGLAHAQHAWWAHIYRITAAECPRPPRDRGEREHEAEAGQRSQTGFKLARFRGIVTALHGVAGCADIRAQPAQGGDPFDVALRYGDVANDLAFLVPRDVDAATADALLPPPVGLLLETRILPPGQPLVVAGFPLSAERVVQSRTDTADPAYRPLWEPLSAHVTVAFSRRRSPVHDARVLSLDGSLHPGHSGAPLLRVVGPGASIESPRVVGMGDGGVENTNISWAISAASIQEMLDKRERPANAELARLGADFSVVGFVTSVAIDANYQAELENMRSWDSVVGFEIGARAMAVYQFAGAAGFGFEGSLGLNFQGPTEGSEAFVFRAYAGLSQVWTWGAYVGPEGSRTQSLRSDHFQPWVAAAVGAHFLRREAVSFLVDAGFRVGGMIFDDDWRIAYAIPMTLRVHTNSPLHGNALYVEGQLAPTYSPSYDRTYTGFFAEVQRRHLEWGLALSLGVGGSFGIDVQ